MNFEQFKIFEKDNPSLKKFLDLYRIEYGLHYYISGNKTKKNFYFQDVDPENIPLNVKFLLKVPPFILRSLLKLKRKLKQSGIDFSIYD
ncbi:hypothetical protein D3C87_1949760 [compost metagenome]